MQTLIYQCWTGPLRPGVVASSDNIGAYAGRIGSEYRFDHNPNIAGRVCDVPAYFEWLNPILDDSFLEYDQVAVLDCDVYAVAGLTDSLFDEPIAEVGICTEPHQPALRATQTGAISAANDERWAREVKRLYGVDLPRDEAGWLKVYNAGVVTFTRASLERARREFVPFQRYIDAMRSAGLPRFYTVDQNYFHAMMVAHLQYTELPARWNCQMHYLGDPKLPKRPIYDGRTPDVALVHVQLRGADDWSAEELHRVVNDV